MGGGGGWGEGPSKCTSETDMPRQLYIEIEVSAYPVTVC